MLELASLSTISAMLQDSCSTREEGIQAFGQDLVVSDSLGGLRNLEFEGPLEAIVYLTSANCGWCRANHKAFIALAERMAGRYRCIYLETVRLESTEKLNTLEVYVLASARPLTARALNTTPTTLIVGNGGKVNKLWTGAYTGSTRRAVEAYFSLDLPDATLSTTSIVDSYTNAPEVKL